MKPRRVTEQAWLRVYRCEALTEQNGRCRYCKDKLTPLTATAEHLQPRSKGGSTNAKNVKASCRACNLTKGSLSDQQFSKLIKNPDLTPETWPRRFYVLMAQARWRINRRALLAERRIRRAVS